jgi:hypothetical protein
LQIIRGQVIWPLSTDLIGGGSMVINEWRNEFVTRTSQLCVPQSTTGIVYTPLGMIHDLHHCSFRPIPHYMPDMFSIFDFAPTSVCDIPSCNLNLYCADLRRPGGNPINHWVSLLWCTLSSLSALYIDLRQQIPLFSSVPFCSVYMSTMFDSVGSQPALLPILPKMPVTVWKQITLCFLLSCASTLEAFVHGTFIVTKLCPSISALQSVSQASATFILQCIDSLDCNSHCCNSDPDVDDLHVFCFLENQSIRALFNYIMNPVCDILITLSLA